MKDLHASTTTWADTLPGQWDASMASHGGDGASTHEAIPDAAVPSADFAQGTAPPAQRLSLVRWMAEGLRGAMLLTPRTAAATPTPLQLLVLSAIAGAMLVAAARWQVAGPAQFNLQAWLAPMWSTLVLLWLAWWAMAPAQRAASARAEHRVQTSAAAVAGPGGGVAAWYVLAAWAPLVPMLLLYGLTASAEHQPDLWLGDVAAAVFWATYGLLTLWALAALVVISGRFIRSRSRTVAFAVAMTAVLAAGIWQFQEAPWEPVSHAEVDPAVPSDAAVQGSPDSAPPQEPPGLVLSQAVFEGQQRLWEQQVQALLPQRAGVADVYGLMFAPFADEDVFRRESAMVSAVLQERFDAKGRVITLLNHADTAATHPWATPENLQRTIAALGAQMDVAQDVLVVYLTSHGARDHALAASHWPLAVAPLTPEMLRSALDAAGIRHRVIAVSACYSGGWIDTLATDATLIMTAADATHTSYGCGRLSELTFFGRAVFNEQLRQTHSFTEAFARAVPLIAQREVEAGKADGFSNPQIRVGAQIAPVLAGLAQRLRDAQAAALAPAGPARSPP